MNYDLVSEILSLILKWKGDQVMKQKKQGAPSKRQKEGVCVCARRNYWAEGCKGKTLSILP